MPADSVKHAFNKKISAAVELDMINSPADFVVWYSRAREIYFTSAAKLGYVHFVIVYVLEIKPGNAFINNSRMHRSRAGGSSNFHALSHEVCKRCIKLYRITKAASWPAIAIDATEIRYCVSTLNRKIRAQPRE